MDQVQGYQSRKALSKMTDWKMAYPGQLRGGQSTVISQARKNMGEELPISIFNQESTELKDRLGHLSNSEEVGGPFRTARVVTAEISSGDIVRGRQTIL